MGVNDRDWMHEHRRRQARASRRPVRLPTIAQEAGPPELHWKHLVLAGALGWLAWAVLKRLLA